LPLYPPPPPSFPLPAGTCTPDYLYYQTASPWLQVKLLQILQYFNPPDDGSLRARMDEVLDRILTKTEVTKSVNKNNADHAILSSMTKLAKLGDVGHLIAEHQNRILFTLKDGDISIRRRALDLVFAMCNESNAEELVDELLNYLVSSSVGERNYFIQSTNC
jgi:AP-2 complex subunit alpha